MEQPEHISGIPRAGLIDGCGMRSRPAGSGVDRLMVARRY